MRTIGYGVNNHGENEYEVYCYKEEVDGSTDCCYEMTGTNREVRAFLDGRGVENYYDNIREYYEVDGEEE